MAGIKFCPIALVKNDLKERKINTRRLSHEQQRARLELILREEEEWQQLVMYRRDFLQRSCSLEFSISVLSLPQQWCLGDSRS
jgi:hypothetical protein